MMKSIILYIFLFVSLNSNSQKFWERFQSELNCLPYSKYFNFKGTNEIHIGFEFKYNIKEKTGLLLGSSSSLNYKNPFSVIPSEQYSFYTGVAFAIGNSTFNEDTTLELRYKVGFFSNNNNVDYSYGIINVLEYRTTYNKKSFIGFGIKNYFNETGRNNWSIYSIFGISL
jgi:hypothetical protein